MLVFCCIVWCSGWYYFVSVSVVVFVVRLPKLTIFSTFCWLVVTLPGEDGSFRSDSENEDLGLLSKGMHSGIYLEILDSMAVNYGVCCQDPKPSLSFPAQPTSSEGLWMFMVFNEGPILDREPSQNHHG